MPSIQGSRRSNPYPFTWEVPVGIVLGILFLLLLGVHAGRALANLVGGAGLTLTPREALLTGLPGLIAGDAGAGLQPRPERVASTGVLWLCTFVVQALNLLLIGWVSRVAWQRWGPGRVEGVATRGELDQLLGLGRLRKVAPVVRPDLYGKAGRR